MEIPTLFLTEIQIDHPRHDAIYAPDAGNPGGFRAVGGFHAGSGHATLTMEMTLTPGAHDIIRRMARARGGFQFGMKREEYRCLWCGVPNPVEHALCSQCGGPRGWIL